MATGQTLCVACGHPLDEGALFCGQCGATRSHGRGPTPETSAAPPVPVGAQTLLQMPRPAAAPAPIAAPASPQTPPPSPPPMVQAPGPTARVAQRTMLGMPALGPEQARAL